MDKPFDLDFERAQPFKQPFHLVPSWEKQIQLIGHLCQYSQNILLVQGALSIGKSSFAHLLTDYKLPGLNKILLQGKSIKSPEQLMDELSQSYELGTPMQFSTYSQSLSNHNAQSPIWTVVVDDADYLSMDTLQALLKLIDFSVPIDQQLRLVLIAENGFDKEMASGDIAAIIDDQIHPLDLEPWQPEDVAFLLEKQGKSVSTTFIQTLLDQTQGYPREILDRISLVTDDEKSVKSIRPSELISKVDKPIIYGVSLGLVLGLGFLIFTYGDDELPINPPLNTAAAEPERTAQQSYELVFKDEMNTKPLKSETRLSQLDKIERHDRTFETLDLVNKNQNKTLAEKSTQTKPVAATSSPKSSEKTVTAKATKHFNLTKDEQKILAKNATNYTLQLAGSSKSPNVAQFLKDHNLKDLGAVVRTTRDGKDWYVLLYGSYSSYEQAKRAASDIANAGKVQPWVRSYKSVHSEIERLAKLKTGVVNLSREGVPEASDG